MRGTRLKCFGHVEGAIGATMKKSYSLKVIGTSIKRERVKKIIDRNI